MCEDSWTPTTRCPRDPARVCLPFRSLLRQDTQTTDCGQQTPPGGPEPERCGNCPVDINMGVQGFERLCQRVGRKPGVSQTPKQGPREQAGAFSFLPRT